jgi:L-cysteine desulfidase
MNKDNFICVLKQEIVNACGCTELGCAALAAARAVEVLGHEPHLVKVVVSPNIYKNGVNVGVPGTTSRGLEFAIAIGVLRGNSELGLSILNNISPEEIEKAHSILKEKKIQLTFIDTPDPVYVKADAKNENESASAIIMGTHDHFSEVTKNGKVIFSAVTQKKAEKNETLYLYSVRALVDLIMTINPKEFDFLLEAAKKNYEAALVGLQNENTHYGPALQRWAAGLSMPHAAVAQTQLMTGAASEARMLGLPISIMAITGSGNHGITNFLGMYAFGKALGMDDEKLALALAISSMITIYIKGYTTRLTAYCGCAIAPATGIAAGATFLLGGEYEYMVHAMQSVIGTFSGMLCDGAKESCAYKVSVVASTAIQFAYLAMDGAFIPKCDGIVGKTIEETFDNLGFLNNPGMKDTDKAVLKILEKNMS